MRHWLDLDDLIAADPVKGAWLSALLDNGRRLFRFALWRVWDSGQPLLVVVMLNPSTADATRDDATIRRLIGFARAHGYGGFIVVNLYAYRVTEPAQLVDVGLRTAEGPDNDRWIEAACRGRDVLFAWGTHGGHRAAAVEKLVAPIAKRLLCLGVTKDGHPCHPVRLAGDTPMVPWASVPAAEAVSA